MELDVSLTGSYRNGDPRHFANWTFLNGDQKLNKLRPQKKGGDSTRAIDWKLLFKTYVSLVRISGFAVEDVCMSFKFFKQRVGPVHVSQGIRILKEANSLFDQVAVDCGIVDLIWSKKNTICRWSPFFHTNKGNWDRELVLGNEDVGSYSPVMLRDGSSILRGGIGKCLQSSVKFRAREQFLGIWFHWCRFVWWNRELKDCSKARC